MSRIPTISILSPTVDNTALDTASHNCTAALNREDVLDRHEEVEVDVALRLRDVAVELSNEVKHALRIGVVLSGASSAFRAEPNTIGSRLQGTHTC